MNTPSKPESPKPEDRNPKESRSPKSEFRNLSLAPSDGERVGVRGSHLPGQALSRRAMLKSMAVAGLGVALSKRAFGQTASRAESIAVVTRYLESLARPDGGYAWADQAGSHLTPSYAAIGCYRLLQQSPPRKSALADFVRSHHPSRLKKLEQEHREFEFQQIQSLIWLGEDASSFREQVSGWTKPTVYLKQYEQHGYPILSHELTAFVCRALLGLPVNEAGPEYRDYLNSRRRANGSFNNTPAADGSDGHVLNTWWGLQALAALNHTSRDWDTLSSTLSPGLTREQQEQTIEWLRACQLPNGGFTYQPKADFGGVDDVAYTWAAVRALHQLGATPANRQACLNYLLSLANADGGFGDRPGWLSNPMATFYALDALQALGALDGLAKVQPNPPPRRTPLPSNLKVFSLQLEAHGKGSPAEAVDLARALRLHLWGAKNAKPEWLARAQALADQQKVPVRFFVANEEYGTWVQVPGLGTYSHTSDIMAPAGCDFGAALANQGVVSWPEFRQRRLAPLRQASGHLIWQFGENEELVRLYLDDSLERGGYAAISTFHFGNPDFTNSEPFLQRYRGRLPFVALQDAHGEEPWWFADMTTGFRTLFLGAEPSWAAWLQALERNWVVAVRHDAVSGLKTWMHGGAPEVLELIRQHEADWRWWDNPQIQRPLVSLVALTPADSFETARPEQGVMLRVRCAWENTAQGLPKKPLAELVKLTVDGTEVSPQLVAKKQPRGPAYLDYYHQYPLPNPVPGKHSATAAVRVIETGAEVKRTVEFLV